MKVLILIQGEKREKYDDIVTAIDDIEFVEANIKVYPTYTSGDFKVETNGSRGMISVYNLTGKLVLQKQIESNLEFVTVNDGGMYIMKVENEEAKRTFKVFKTHFKNFFDEFYTILSTKKIN
mgnify:CR=1 FL=1